MQHIKPNSKRWDYSDIPGGSHGQIKGPAHMVEGGYYPRNRPPTLGTMSVDFYHYPVTVWAYSTPQPNTEVPAPTGGRKKKKNCHHYKYHIKSLQYHIKTLKEEFAKKSNIPWIWRFIYEHKLPYMKKTRKKKHYQQLWRYYNHISVPMPLINSYLTSKVLHMLWHSGELHILAPLALLLHRKVPSWSIRTHLLVSASSCIRE